MNNPILQAQIIEREIADLIANYPELLTDEDFRLDAIHGETGAIEFLESLLTKEREADAMAAAIKTRMDALRSRKDAAETRKEAIRKLMHRVMTAADLKKVPLAEATLSVRAVPPSALVTDENAIPDQFWKLTRTLDKKSLADELRAGHPVPGAMMSSGGETLAVRS